METKKRTYFKLGVKASVFSDNANGMKITKNVPGSTLKPESKLTKEAAANGHIIPINKEEFDEMMSKLNPGMKKAAYKEQNIQEEENPEEGKGGKEDDDDDDDEADAAVRADLLERSKKIQMTKSKRKEVEAMETAELKAFVEQEESK